MRTLGTQRSRTARWAWAAAIVILAAGTVASAGAEKPAVDDLLAQVFAPKHKGTYEITADFNGTLLIYVAGKTWKAIASGSFKEWRRGGEGLRRRSVAISRFRLPLLLRPFAGALRNVIAQRIETQTEDPAAFEEHDFFLLEYRGDNSYTLVGVYKALVDAAFERYKSAVDRQDPATRRAIAQWLYTSPMMRP